MATSLQRHFLDNNGHFSTMATTTKARPYNSQLINDWRTMSTKNPMLYIEGHETWSALPRRFLFYCYILIVLGFSMLR